MYLILYYLTSSLHLSLTCMFLLNLVFLYSNISPTLFSFIFSCDSKLPHRIASLQRTSLRITLQKLLLNHPLVAKPPKQLPTFHVCNFLVCLPPCSSQELENILRLFLQIVRITYTNYSIRKIYLKI